MVVNVLLLSAFSVGVYAAVVSNATPKYSGLGTGQKAQSLLSRLDTLGKAQTVPTTAQFLNPDGVYFGAATQQAPFSASEVQDVASTAGAAPSMTEYFVKWTQPFDPAAVADAYRHGTLPVISWEPWAGGVENNGALAGAIPKANIDQPQYRLSNIYDGKFDSYITAFAKAVAADKWPVALRFAHEMNGTWYPWSEQVNGNAPGDYVKAWQHVHDLFQQAGATNVIWVWSPNIIRPVPNTRLSELYPGDKYVDWIGLTGYGVKETSADQTFDPTLKELATFTKKPILITETGAQPGPDKTEWINSFFPWLIRNPDVIGYIWTEKDQQTGANADWRYSDDAADQAAFDSGLKTLKLATGLSTPAGR
jgi:beta-mannanase